MPVLMFLGYDIRTQSGYDEMMHDLEQFIGLNYLKAVHINDSRGYFLVINSGILSPCPGHLCPVLPLLLASLVFGAPSATAPATCNSIPTSIKNCPSLYSFKHHLKSHLIAQLINN